MARGNLKVFEEIGLEFARYVNDCPPGDADALRRFLDGLRPGDPPDGQDYLRRAFAHYEQRRAATDPKAAAELGVLANLEIGLHEQTRLQPEIRAGLDAPFVTQERLGLRVLEAAFPSAARLWADRAPPGRGRRRRGRGARPARVDADRPRGHHGSFMTLSLPGRTLALGMHLADEYPEALREPANAELAELLARYEPVPPAPGRLRRARLVGARPAHALHRPSLPRVPRLARPRAAAVQRGAAREPPPRRGARRRAVARQAFAALIVTVFVFVFAGLPGARVVIVSTALSVFRFASSVRPAGFSFSLTAIALSGRTCTVVLPMTQRLRCARRRGAALRASCRGR